MHSAQYCLGITEFIITKLTTVIPINVQHSSLVITVTVMFLKNDVLFLRGRDLQLSPHLAKSGTQLA